MMMVSNSARIAHVIAPHCHMKGPGSLWVGARRNRTAGLSCAGSIECRYSWSSPTNVKSATALRESSSTTARR